MKQSRTPKMTNCGSRKWAWLWVTACSMKP
jgi:hypothetical protein